MTQAAIVGGSSPGSTSTADTCWRSIATCSEPRCSGVVCGHHPTRRPVLRGWWRPWWISDVDGLAGPRLARGELLLGARRRRRLRALVAADERPGDQGAGQGDGRAQPQAVLE